MICDVSTETKRRARREVQRKFGAVYLLYLGFYLLYNFSHPARNSALAYVLLACVSLSMVAMVVTLAVVTTRHRDEFQRQLLMQAILWGVCGTFAITTVWGMLETFTDLPRLPILATFPIFIVIMAAAKLTLFRRYRAANE